MNQMCNRFPSTSGGPRDKQSACQTVREEGGGAMPKITDESTGTFPAPSTSWASFRISTGRAEWSRFARGSGEGRFCATWWKTSGATRKTDFRRWSDAKDAPDELVIAYGGTDPADIRAILTSSSSSHSATPTRSADRRHHRQRHSRPGLRNHRPRRSFLQESWHFSESGSVTSEDGIWRRSFCRKMQSGYPGSTRSFPLLTWQ